MSDLIISIDLKSLDCNYSIDVMRYPCEKCHSDASPDQNFPCRSSVARDTAYMFKGYTCRIVSWLQIDRIVSWLQIDRPAKLRKSPIMLPTLLQSRSNIFF